MSRNHGEIPQRMLGSTGERVSIVGLGGHHIGRQADEKESIAIIRTAIDNGITFMDNCWDYNDGESELRMGKALHDGYRQRVFLMTKIDGRDRNTAEGQIEQSLRSLQTDVIDLLQMHELIFESDPDRIFAPGGAIEALETARRAGKVRFIGFTGHKSPDILLRTLDMAMERGIRFDAVQMPLNVLDAHYDSFEQKVLPMLIAGGIGAIGMKPIGEARILESGAVSAVECLRYAMSLPVSTTLTGCDSLDILNQALGVARGFTPLTATDCAALLARTTDAARDGRYELYKTTDVFDNVARNLHWLG